MKNSLIITSLTILMMGSALQAMDVGTGDLDRQLLGGQLRKIMWMCANF
jgi:hypothetical protein